MFSVRKTDLVKEILFMQAHFVKCSRIPTELINTNTIDNMLPATWY